MCIYAWLTGCITAEIHALLYCVLDWTLLSSRPNRPCPCHISHVLTAIPQFPQTGQFASHLLQ
jgi:hypothetical protein